MDSKIHAAVRAAEDRPDIARSIAWNPEEINVADRSGNPPLATATILGKYNICKVLLEHGANVNMKNGDGMTPLAIASEQGHYLIAKMYLRFGAQVEEPDAHGMSPLMWTAWAVRPDCVALLISEHANINIRCNAGHTALTYAIGDVPPTCVSRLFSKLEAIGRVTNKMSQVFLAIKQEQAQQRAEIVEFLLSQGAIV